MNRDPACHVVPGTPGPFLVDGFRHVKSHPATRSFFLSHYHSDHYTGLKEEALPNGGLIFCSEITARLLVAAHGISERRVRAQRLNAPFEVEGVRVTFVDANHCPGAVLLLFELAAADDAPARSVLHCGDMRYHPAMREEPTLQRLCGKLDTIFLDTTYAEEKHKFEPQSASIRRIVEEVVRRGPAAGEEAESASGQWTCLVLLGAYTIGKEKVLLEVAKACKLPIFVEPEKLEILRQLGLSSAELALFVTEPTATPLHVCRMGTVGEIWPYFQPAFDRIRRYIQERSLPFTSALGVLPTGWADSSNFNRKNSVQTNDEVTVMTVAYSEHSNMEELQSFVGWLRPTRLVPTVFADEKARKKIQAQFSSLLNTNAVKRQFLSSFGGSKARKVQKRGAASSPSCVEGGGGSAEAQGETAWAEAEAAWDRACAEADRDGAAEDDGDAAAAAKARVAETPVAASKEGAGAAPPGVDAGVWAELPAELQAQLQREMNVQRPKVQRPAASSKQSQSFIQQYFQSSK